MQPHTPESLAVLLGPDLKVTLQLRWASLPKNDCHARHSARIALLLTSGAQAAGFYIAEVGTPRSLGTAGVANPTSTGANAAWSNPAGLALVDQDQMCI